MSSEITPLLVSIKDAAALLGINHKTVRNQVSLGKFPLSIVKIGGRSLFRVADIHALVAAPVVAAPDPVKRGRGRPRKSGSSLK